MKPVRVCAVQAGPALFDTPASLDRMEGLAARAAQGGAQLCVFPEAFIGGYPKGHDFGAPVGSRSAEGRDWFRRYYDGAIDIDGPEVARLGAAAAQTEMDIVIGVIERGGADEGASGTLYCAVLFFSADGTLCGKRRKLMPTAAERVIWGQGDGSTLGVSALSAGRVGALICWENFMPMARMSQYAQGVEILCAPTVDDRESWSALMRAVALEGRCFVVSANQFLRRADAPVDYPLPANSDKSSDILINGGSMIVSPLGEVLAGPVYGEQTLLFGDLDPADIVRGKMDFDVTGHYARPDIFELAIDRTARAPVRTRQEDFF